ncbi:MAG: hypothetical protein Fur0032_06770 [Terrimicrobiaceae bacterium]
MQSATTPPSDERVLTDESLGMELFWEKNKNVIILGSVVLVLAVLAVLGFWAYRESSRAAAARALAEAGNLEALRAVSENFRGSNPGAVASILVAADLRTGGNIKASTEAFESFAASEPNSPLFVLARLGVAQNAAASGDMETALSVYRELGAGTDPFAAPLARLFEARELVDSGKWAEARSLLQSISSEFPSSIPARLVSGQLEQISLVEPPAAASN